MSAQRFFKEIMDAMKTLVLAIRRTPFTTAVLPQVALDKIQELNNYESKTLMK